MPAESFYTDRKPLEHVTARMFEVDFPELAWRDLLDVNSETPAGAEFYAFEQEELIGEAKVSHEYGRSAPKAEVKNTKISNPIVPLLGSFEYSVQDVRAAAMEGRDLAARKAIGARELVERALDELMLVGSSKHGVEGLFNNSSVPTASVAGGVWSGKTADQKIGDITSVMGTMVDSTNGREGSVIDIVLPHSQYVDLATERVSDTGMTALAYIMQNIPEIRSIRKNHRLNSIGAGSTDRMLMYFQDPSKVEGILSLDVMSHEPQLAGLVWETIVEARAGGSVFYKPFSAYYADGI